MSSLEIKTHFIKNKLQTNPPYESLLHLIPGVLACLIIVHAEQDTEQAGQALGLLLQQVGLRLALETCKVKVTISALETSKVKVKVTCKYDEFNFSILTVLRTLL